MTVLQKIKNILSDPELAALALFSAILLYFYETEEMRLATLVWLFYFQNIFIGIQYYLRIGNLEGRLNKEDKLEWIERSGIAFYVNGEQVDPSTFSVKNTFILPYAFMHFLYMIFLFFMTFWFLSGTFNLNFFLISLLFIAINTFFSTLSHYKSDIENIKNKVLTTGLVKLPYLRIVPMHFFIIGVFAMIGLSEKKTEIHTIFSFFLLAKSIADILMHVYINRTWDGPRPKAFGGYI